MGKRDDSPNTDGGYMPESCAKELRSKTASHVLLTPEIKPSVGAIMQCQDFGSWLKLLRVTSYVARAMFRVLNKGNGDSQEADLMKQSKCGLLIHS
jgi:hypothetical protein